MKRTAKRILSTLLIVVMLIGVAPTGGIDFTLNAKAMDLSSYKVGDLIEFGSYPQSEVTDEEILNGIKSVEDNYKWIDYNYYAGTGNWDDGNMKSVDGMMLYKDITYNGNTYRAVKINQYRPYWTCETSSASNSWQDDNGYYTNKVYYFKYEPLKWRVLDASTGLIVCDSAIDSQPYNNYILGADGQYWSDSNKKHYASNWEYSSLRAWLNNEFYNTAFSKTQQDRIKELTRENKSTYDSKYDSNPTSDKITLLSYDEVLNKDYGFNSSSEAYDTARQRKGTDYAKCQGLYVYNDSGSNYNRTSYWWLRSPDTSLNAGDVKVGGYMGGSFCINMTNEGVIPAFKFNPKSTICDVHEYKAVVTEPTCTEQGYTTYTCTKCNDSYVDNYTNALGHDFGEWKLTTPATCTEIGVETRYCSRCNVTQTRDVDKSAHIFGEWKITTAPTTISDGVKTRYCKNCDAFETESVGKLKAISVKLKNIETNYKKSGQLEPKITNPDNVGCKVEYKSSDPKCVIVDADGNYFAVKTGSAKITCTVTDEYGKVTTAECKVNVKYSTVQWIIMIVLFGWIWY
ncbi:uncharacterized protein BN710_00940 [Ruminococcus sp. CAG:563]|nr:uncharacterized protein BN710_00940 [Ruminococcus sp. CAG:563]